MTEKIGKKDRPIFIFVHGFWGSTLEAEAPRSKRLWFPSLASLLLSRDRTNLASPITWSKTCSETGIPLQDKGAIQASEVFFTYGKLIKFMDRVESDSPTEVHRFVWDWRRTFEESSARLETFLTSLNLGGDRKVVLVSHSTGSTITWPVLNRHPLWFNTWVTVGGALGSSNLTLGMLENGWRAGPLTLLDPETMFTHASMYCFYCDIAGGEVTDCPDGVHYHVKSKEEVDIDLFDIDQWEKRNMGLYAVRKKQGTSVSPAERQHLENCLLAAKRFRNENFVRRSGVKSLTDTTDPRFLAEPLGSYDHLRIICYGSDDHSTHKGFGFDDESGVINTLEISHHSGDGTVRSDGWKFIRGGLKHEVIQTSSQHVGLCDDESLHTLICQLLGIDDALSSPPTMWSKLARLFG
jgi:hypothetical protein